jgi:fimbrial chaperone protein
MFRHKLNNRTWPETMGKFTTMHWASTKQHKGPDFGMTRAFFPIISQRVQSQFRQGQQRMAKTPETPSQSWLASCQTWLAIACTMLAWALTTGFSVIPVVLDAVSVGPRSSAQITVTNPNPTNLPVEITIQEVTMDEKGGAKDRRDASADFLILPPQATLNAGQARVFTLQYIGEADLAESRYFEWGVDQVPVTLPEGQNAVQIVYAISGILCVAPATGKSDVSVVGTAIETTREGKFQPVLSMRNAGNAHAFLSRGVLRLSLRDKAGKIVWRQTLRAQEIGQVVGVGVLPALRTRDVKVPIDLPSADGVVVAEFSLPASNSRSNRR